mgnify:CR=1 FL=1
MASLCSPFSLIDHVLVCLQVEYSLRSGTGYFSIDPVSGLITLTRSVSTSPVIHSITVRASDLGQPQKTTEQSIKIILSSSVPSGLMVCFYYTLASQLFVYISIFFLFSYLHTTLPVCTM